MAHKKSPTWSMNYVYTQPYSVPLHNPFYNNSYDTHMRLAQELLLLDEIDRRVATMTEFPQVQQLMEKLR